MRFLHPSWLTPPVGLDWGSRWGKLVHLRRKGQTFTLNRIARFCWPAESEGDKSTRLKTVWSHLRLHPKTVFLALGGNTFLTSPADTLNLDRNLFQLQQPGSKLTDLADKTYSDSTVLYDNRGSPRHLRISASRQQVEEARQQIQQAGLRAKVIDNKALALCNMYTFAYADQKIKPAYLLHLGQTHSLLLLLQHGIPIWLERLDITGDALANSGGQTGHESQPPLSGSRENVGEKIAAILQARKQQAGVIYLSGGAALFPHLPAYLRDSLALDIRILNCWRGLHIDHNFFDANYLEAIAPQFAVACGMALRAASKKKAGEQP